MEITINEKAYPLKATFAFMRKIEKTSSINQSGVNIKTGFVEVVTQLTDMGDMDCLVELILALNTGQKPELSRSVLEKYLEEQCEDIEALADEVIDFLSKANVCKKKMRMFQMTQQTEDQKSLAA